MVEEHLDPGARQPVDEPGRRVEQHHDRVEVPVGGGPPMTAPGTGLGPPLGSPLVCHSAQSTSSAVDRACGGLPDHREHSGDPAGGSGPAPLHGGQLGRVTQRLDQQDAGRTAITAGQRESPQPLAQPALGERSAPPSAECSRAIAASSSSRSGSTAQRSASSSGATAGWVASGRSSAWVVIGTPAWDSARCRVGRDSVVERTITAIRSQGTSWIRCASRSRWAR